MKKLLLLIAAIGVLLSGCKKIEESIDALGARINKLEQETIPSIDEQIAAINTTLSSLDAMDKELKGYIDGLQATADNLQERINAINTKIDEVKGTLQGEISTAKSEVLAQLNAVKTELENELAQINATIATLQEKDKELDNKIADLKTYVNNELISTENWVNATFATLTQYNALVAEVTTIKAQIVAINESIADLETRLTTKINEDIANAVASLNADIQQKVSEITTAYTNAVKTAKEAITAAYTAAIQNAINALDASLKSWVGEQLANYYTIAEIDAMLATMEQEMNGKLEAQKAYLEGLINELSAALAKSIADNKVLIDALRNDVTTLQGESAEHASKIVENATAISTNAQSIINNATAIAQNGENIEANEKLIADNKALIEANTKAIAENKSAIEALKSSTSTAISKNATDIAQNASNIAKNASLISQNATAIANNQLAISHNATDIAQLQQDLITTAAEITVAYKKAIEEAINTNNGVIDTKIATQVSTINTRIDNEVSTINNAINALKSRVAALENEVNAIKQQIANILSDITDMKEDISALLARIQSVSYIPEYADGKVVVTRIGSTSYGELSFRISPKDAVVELEKVWSEALSCEAYYPKTRAISLIKLTVTEYIADAESGIITVKISGERLSEEFFAGTQEAKVALVISDGNNQVVSDYADMVGKGVTDEIWYTSSNGNVVTPYYATDAFNANIVSNTYERGKGVIKFDGDVTSIGDNAFYGRTSLTSVTIPDSVTSIGNVAFSGCSSLKAFYGKYASSDNRCLVVDGVLNSFAPAGLTEYTIPDSVTSIGEYALFECTSLTSVTIPDSVTSIGEYAFLSCSSLKAFCGKYASSDNRCLVVDGVLNSFAIGCDATKYTIPNSVTSIGEEAFAYCTSLTSVTIPDSVTSIGYRAFHRCTSLTSVTMPDSVTSIGRHAFSRCTSLTSVTIPDSVTSIGDGAFGRCSSLTSVTIPDSVTSIGEQAFVEGSSLKAFYGKYASSDNRCLVVDGVLNSFAPAGLTEYTIPDSVTSIGRYTFASCTSLTSVTIPDSVTSIVSVAFAGCSSLTSVYCKPTTPPSLGMNTFSGANSTTIFVPTSAVNLYKISRGWSSYADYIVGYNF